VDVDIAGTTGRFNVTTLSTVPINNCFEITSENA
jgi:hypothetical protein